MCQPCGDNKEAGEVQVRRRAVAPTPPKRGFLLLEQAHHSPVLPLSPNKVSVPSPLWYDVPE